MVVCLIEAKGWLSKQMSCQANNSWEKKNLFFLSLLAQRRIDKLVFDFTRYKYVFIVHLYLKNILQTVSTLMKLLQKTVILYEERYSSSCGFLEDIGCVLQLITKLFHGNISLLK